MTKDFHRWRKSRYSEPNGECIEAGRAVDGSIGVRDTQLDRSPIIEFSPAEWARFLDRIRHDA